jgi:hypothetical protein
MKCVCLLLLSLLICGCEKEKKKIDFSDLGGVPVTTESRVADLEKRVAELEKKVSEDNEKLAACVASANSDYDNFVAVNSSAPNKKGIYTTPVSLLDFAERKKANKIQECKLLWAR